MVALGEWLALLRLWRSRSPEFLDRSGFSNPKLEKLLIMVNLYIAGDDRYIVQMQSTSDTTYCIRDFHGPQEPDKGESVECGGYEMSAEIGRRVRGVCAGTDVVGHIGPR